MHSIARAFLVTLALAPGVAVADPKAEAQGHVAKAMEAHESNDFTTALAELQAAYALDPVPELLYAIGQVYVKLERCPDAVDAYKKFLGTKPTPQAESDTREAIKACERRGPTTTPTTTEPTTGGTVGSTGTTADATPVPPPDPGPAAPGAQVDAPRAWYKDPVAGALVGGGVAAAVVSVIFYGGAKSALDDAEAAPTLAQYEDHVDSAGSKRTLSVVFAVGGVGLITAGVVRYVMKRDAAEPTQVGVTPTVGGGLLTFGGQF